MTYHLAMGRYQLEHLVEFMEPTTAALVASAKAVGVTVNTLLQYEWTHAVAGYAPFNVPAGVDLAAGGPMDARSALGPKYERTLSNLFGLASGW